jgi:hypothetical protein
MRLTRILALSPAQVLRARDLATAPPTSNRVARRLGVVQATGLASSISTRASALVKWRDGVLSRGLCCVNLSVAVS